MANIFISYASEDRDRIKPLVEAFEAEGWSVWWDRHIATGESFDRVIERELDSASCVVVAWTRNSVESSWVRNEASEGLEREILAPVLLEKVKPPLAFRGTQVANLVGWPRDTHTKDLREFVADIRKIVGDGTPPSRDPHSRTAPEETSLAILPLADLTEDRNFAYFCDGLAEDLMTAAFQLQSIRVLSARDTFAFRDSEASIREIGEALGATMVLEGSVRSARGRMVVNTRLIQVGDGRTLHSERFVGDTEDPIDLQSEIAAKVLSGIRSQLEAEPIQAVAIETTRRNPEAYGLYQQAQSAETPGLHNFLFSLRQVATLECVIALDPDFEQAYSDLSISYARLKSVVGAQGAKTRARSLLDQLKRRRPLSRAAWAIEVELEDDMDALVTRCVESIEKGEGVYAYPHPVGWHDVRAGLGRALAHAGLHQEGYEYFSQVDRTGEPQRYDNWLHQLGCLVAIGDFEPALEHAKRMRAVTPNPPTLVKMWEFVAHIAKEDFNAAQQLIPQFSDQSQWFPAEAIINARQGKEVSLEFHPTEFDASTADGDITGYSLLAVGLIEQGIDCLEERIGVLSKFGDCHWMGFRAPIYRHLFGDEVKQHPRFRALVSSLRLDVESRTRIQKRVDSLTSVTSIETAPLLEI